MSERFQKSWSLAMERHDKRERRRVFRPLFKVIVFLFVVAPGAIFVGWASAQLLARWTGG